MFKKIFVFFSVLVIFCVPVFSFAAGLVPCGNPGEPSCTTCHAFQVVHNVMQFGFIYLTIPLTAIAFVVGGVLMLTAVSNETQITRGRSIIASMIKGLFVMFCAWVIVNTIVNVLASGSINGLPWYQFPGCAGSPSPIDVGPSLPPPPPPAPPTPPPPSTTLKCSADRNSSQLDALISCVTAGATAQGLTIQSVTTYQGQHTCNLSQKPPNISCHYGGRVCNGVAHAADFTIPRAQRSPANWSKLRQIAANCPSSAARCEIGVAPFISSCDNQAVNHIHVNDSVSCGCN